MASETRLAKADNSAPIRFIRDRIAESSGLLPALDQFS
jgi:hypothetical protein